MSISANTVSELKKVTAYLDFLLTVSNVKFERIPEDRRECIICKEPYDKNDWKLGETANRPVELQCGHIFGIQCLARLIFQESFSNKCPLCRAQIIPESFEKAPSRRAWEVTAPLLRPFALYNQEIIPYIKEELLEVIQSKQWDAAPGKYMDRVMILYEEFIQHFCDYPPGLDDKSRALALNYKSKR